ncbi:PAS domain-containing protein [Sphingosinicella sp. BN140058]|uniref:PAS domain-containing protein n=1 Tax=Sphingosinicella sp. BN140058 TaxID=1892855 RepID=UPI001010632D|nr:PAS domain-containing protein [Sphingosinicella sp. BN140058]QAY79609.1 PAS domain-containing protein [Sphingosinicella sp. BN140058]
MSSEARSLSEYRQLISRHSWSATGLGSQSSWPALLRGSVDIILDTMQPSFIAWGGDYSTVFNEAFSRRLDPGSWLGRPLPELWGEAWANIAPHHREALGGRGVLVEDIPVPSALGGGGETRYITLSLTPLRESDTQVVGVLAICTDTTEKVRAAERLEKEHERLVRLFEDAPGFVGKMRVPDFSFVAANSAYRRLIGHRPVIGLTLFEALPELADQGVVEILEEVCRSGEPYIGRAMELLLRNPRGEEMHVVDLVCAPFKGADGAVEAILIAGHDVSEHVRSERHVEELRGELIHLSRVSAMGTMASTLGHELNQPLTAIVNYASVAQRSTPDPAPPMLAMALKAISDNALRAGQLIRSLRTMSRKGARVQQSFSVDEAVNEALKLTRFSSRCPVVVDCAPGLQACGDRVQIEQVLINLIRNACEATAGVAAPRVEVKAVRANGVARITVIDNGSGISLDPVEKVFAPFMSTKPNGIGIGLPISRTIAEAHGGRLSAENNAGAGATFKLEIPCDCPGASASGAKAAAGAGAAARVDGATDQSLEA